MSNIFLPLNQTSRAWRGMCSTPNGDVYACVSDGDIYKQEKGIGDFIALGQASRHWHLMTAAPNGDIYACVGNGDIYKKPAGADIFLSLGQATRNWFGMTAAPNGDVYASVFNGDIYKQERGVGDFIALSQTVTTWRGMCSTSNGDVYLTDAASLYRQKRGVGAFAVVVSAIGGDLYGLTIAPNDDIYISNSLVDIYRYINGEIGVVALNQAARVWTGLCSTPNGDIYACVDNGDIYKLTNIGSKGNMNNFTLAPLNEFGQPYAINMPTVGTAVHGDADTDPASLFDSVNGLDVSGYDYVPKKYFRVIEICGGTSGQGTVSAPVYIKVMYINGSMNIKAFVIAKNTSVFIEGYFQKILSSGTTATAIFPYF